MISRLRLFAPPSPPNFSPPSSNAAWCFNGLSSPSCHTRTSSGFCSIKQPDGPVREEEWKWQRKTARKADKVHACESPVVLWPGCRNVEAFPAHCTNQETDSDTWCRRKRVFIDRLQILAIYLILIYSFILTVQVFLSSFRTLSGNLSCFTWFVVKGIFLVFPPVRKTGEEHGLCEQWNICRKAEREEVIVLLLMLDWNKTYREKNNNKTITR